MDRFRYYKIYDTSALAHSKIHFMRFPTHLLAWLEAIMLPSNVYHSTVVCAMRCTNSAHSAATSASLRASKALYSSRSASRAKLRVISCFHSALYHWISAPYRLSSCPNGLLLLRLNCLAEAAHLCTIQPLLELDLRVGLLQLAFERLPQRL